MDEKPRSEEERELERRDRGGEKPTHEAGPFSGPGGPQGGPGQSGPGEPGYEGRVTVGDEGGAADEPAQPVRDE